MIGGTRFKTLNLFLVMTLQSSTTWPEAHLVFRRTWMLSALQASMGFRLGLMPPTSRTRIWTNDHGMRSRYQIRAARSIGSRLRKIVPIFPPMFLQGLNGRSRPGETFDVEFKAASPQDLLLTVAHGSRRPEYWTDRL